MRLVVAVALLGFSLVVSVGCGRTPPPPPVPAKPPSAWTTADSQAVAKELGGAAAREDWAVAFRTRNNRAPKVAVGEIQDKTGDHVDVGELAAQLEQVMAESQQVAVVGAPAEADYLMTGSIGREPIAGGWRYAVDLRLAASDGDPAWVGGLEREIKAPAETPAPAPAKPAAK